MMSNVQQVRRQLKNVAYNFSDAQVKVREATSNDPWGPSSSLMSEIADMTYNTMAFTEVMQMIWKRLNDSGKNWRHVYKSLVLLDYLIKTGSEKVAQQCKENIYAIQTLKDFQHIEENKDQGMNVREKAKQLVSLLKDDERLKNERARALMAKKRFAQNSMGISSDGSSAMPHQPQRRMYRSESELEEARPSNVGEEELQLQIALALSREEAEREAELKRGDDARLQMAIDVSRTEPEEGAAAHHPTSSFNGQSSGSNLNDLLGLSNGGMGGNAWGGSAANSGSMANSTDPWGAISSTGANSQPDPWAAVKPPPSKAVAADPWAPISSDPAATASNDPFAPLPVAGSTSNGQHPTPIAASIDPWSGGLDTLQPKQSSSSDLGLMTGEARQLKTPETFLGENSSLVNLDNLVGPTFKSTVPGMPPSAKAANNPFLGGSSAPTNPFAAQQRPSPTLNQMRVSQKSTSVDQWNLPQPLQPAKTNTSPTNPFL